MTRSRAWLAVPAAPIVVLAGLVGGPLVAIVALAALVQATVLWSRAPAIAATTVDLLSVGRRGGSAALGASAVLFFRVLPAAVGCVALLVAVDWVTGASLTRLTEGDPGRADAIDLAAADLPPARDARADLPAYAGSPWAERYFAELEAVPFTYVPFIGPREAPVRGRYINSVDGVRASYEPPGVDAPEAVDVWFFGGSTLWGEGQRDLHTIPSEVARLAERDGRTLRVRNFGVRGYTAFQEFLVFEQELARRGPPDLAVFYHGVNELYSLLEAPSNLGSQPSIFQLDVYARAFRRAPPQPGPPPPLQPSVAEVYGRTGIVTKLWRAAVESFGTPAGAEDGPYLAPIEDVERARLEAPRIYRRSVGLIRHLAAAHDVPTVILWQPGGLPPVGPGAVDDYADLGRMVATAGGGIDISDALADPRAPIYIDGVHTNELGAQMAAEAVWREIAPAVAEVGS